jgi:lysophospholipase
MKTFMGAANISLSYRIFPAKNPIGKILFCTGYNESYIKYLEFISDLNKMNFSVYCYDHRGQGFSQRFENQNHRGYVDHFSYFVSDFSLFYRWVQEEEKDLPIFVLAHSMGAAIVTLALGQKTISNPKGVILSSPMFEINMFHFSFLELPLLMIAQFFVKLGFEKEYALGQGDCIPLPPFEKNQVTHSEVRFSVWRNLISKDSRLQLGGPTFGWIAQSVQASRCARKMGPKIDVPLLILQAEQDTIVHNGAQNKFAQNCPKAKVIVCKGSRHEILMEINEIRNEALEQIKKFTLQQSSSF